MINWTLMKAVRLTALAAGLATLVMVALPGAAQPAFPGANGKIAYTNYTEGGQIDVMNADGSGVLQLTTSGFNGWPRWSPDGTKIAFASDRDGNEEIYLMNRDGTGQTRLTNAQEADVAPTWSPDGNRIAFVSRRNGQEIYVMNADGSGQMPLTVGSANASPAWSPDGSKIAFSSDRDGQDEIYVMNIDGSGQTRLTNISGSDDEPAWSPDGSKLAFMSTRDGSYQIYVMNADGSGQTRLTNDPAYSFDPAWSADGRRITFSSERDGFDDIYVVNADGSGSIDRLTNGLTAFQPDWQTVRSADLALSMAASPSPVKGNQPLTYTLTVLNAGPSAANGVVVTDTVPSQTTFVSATPSKGSCLTPPTGSTGTVTCNLGSLAVPQQAVTQVVVKVLARKASVTNTASVASSTSDPNPVNNTASISTVIK